MEAVDSSLSNYYERFCNFMQKDTKGVEIGIYTAAGILFAYSYYKIRPITKFGKGKDIPKLFIRDKITQYGNVKAINPGSKNGPFVLVNHRPPLPFLVPSKKLLPIQLPGIAVNANGYSWLQTVAVGKQIEFIPISQDGSDNSAICKLLILCPENKQQVIIDASEALLSLGFAKTVAPPKQLSSAEWQPYYKRLLKIEENAKKQRQGVWSSSIPPKPWPLRVTQEKLNSLILSILPVERRLPELVR